MVLQQVLSTLVDATEVITAMDKDGITALFFILWNLWIYVTTLCKLAELPAKMHVSQHFVIKSSVKRHSKRQFLWDIIL